MSTIGALALIAPKASAAPGSPTPSPAVIDQADKALRANPSALRVSDADAYTVFSTKVDSDGAAHVRYTRTYHGLRVRGGDFVVHLSPDGTYDSSSAGLAAPLSLDTTPKVAADAATAGARATFRGTITTVDQPELFVEASSGTGRLAWETRVVGWAPDGQTPSRLHVVSDAINGALIGSFDEIESIQGTGNSVYSGSVGIDTTRSGSTYQLVDPSHGNNRTCDMNNGTSTCTTFTDADNVWGTGNNSNRQSAAADAHYGSALTFDYYKNTHGRNGIFGDGTGVPSRVHYGSGYANAFWDGSQMTYGDGAGNARPLVSLDVAGHEMSHGVTENVVPGGLTYSGESGGLNEATSDIFGTMVEFYANNATDPGDYLIGEKVNINGNGTPLRYMYNPSLDGVSDSCWSTGTKNKNVHYSSGVANHFYFDLAEGTGATAFGNSPVCGSAPAVTGIGRAKAQKIWYRALDVYFTSSTAYVNTTNPANTARAYSLHAASDLYGACGTEYRAVQAAWAAVNVPANANEGNCITGIVRASLNGTDGLWTQASATATCPAGKRVIGGYGSVTGQARLVSLIPLHNSIPDRDQFSVTGRWPAGVAIQPWHVSVQATCADPLPGLGIVWQDSETSSTTFKTAAASCPAGRQVLGTGASLGSHAGEVGLVLTRPDGPRTISRASAREDADGYAGTWFLRSYVICADPTGTHANGAIFNSPQASPTCTGSPGTQAISVGWGGGLIDTGPSFLNSAKLRSDSKGFDVSTTGLPTGGMVAEAICLN